MSTSRPLGRSEALVSGGAHPPFRAACFARDREGQLYGLAPRHILAHTRGAIRTTDGGVVGDEVGPLTSPDSIAPFEMAIAAFRLAPEVAPSGSMDGPPVIGVAEACINDAVELQGFRWPGKIIGLGGLAYLRDPLSGDETAYDEVIEVQFAAGESAFGPGSAGLLVLKGARALGLLIAGRPDRALVAPLRPFLQRSGLQLLRELTPQITVERVKNTLPRLVEVLTAGTPLFADLDKAPPAHIVAATPEVEHAY